AIPVTSRTRIERIADASLLRLTGRRVREPFIDVNCSEPQRRTAERAVQTPDAQDANLSERKLEQLSRSAGGGGEARDPAAPGSQPTSEGWRLEPEAMKRMNRRISRTCRPTSSRRTGEESALS